MNICLGLRCGALKKKNRATIQSWQEEVGAKICATSRRKRSECMMTLVARSSFGNGLSREGRLCCRAQVVVFVFFLFVFSLYRSLLSALVVVVVFRRH